MNTNIDPNKYVSIGVDPRDVPSFDAETIAALDEKLAMTPEQRHARLSAKFDEAILRAKERESAAAITPE